MSLMPTAHDRMEALRHRAESAEAREAALVGHIKKVEKNRDDIWCALEVEQDHVRNRDADIERKNTRIRDLKAENANLQARIKILYRFGTRLVDVIQDWRRYSAGILTGSDYGYAADELARLLQKTREELAVQDKHD